MNNITKTCTRCQVSKSLDEFGKANKTPSGEQKYHSRCKVCNTELQREARTQEPDRFREASNKCHASHREERLAKQRNWRRSNLDRERARVQQWMKDNPELYRAYQHAYRARRYAAIDGSVTTEFIQALYRQEQCCYCNKEIPREDRTIDHIVPISRGGKHSTNNLAMCCGSCNSSKRNRLLSEWRQDEIKSRDSSVG